MLDNLAKKITDELSVKLAELEFPAASNNDTATGLAPDISKAIIGNLKKIAQACILGPYDKIPEASELVTLIVEAVTSAPQESLQATNGAKTAKAPHINLKELLNGFGRFCADAIKIRDRMQELAPHLKDAEQLIKLIYNPSENRDRALALSEDCKLMEHACALLHYYDYLSARLGNGAHLFDFPIEKKPGRGPIQANLLKNELICQAVERILMAQNSKVPLPRETFSNENRGDLLNKLRGSLYARYIITRSYNEPPEGRIASIDIRARDGELLGCLSVITRPREDAADQGDNTAEDIEKTHDIFAMIFPFWKYRLDNTSNIKAYETEFLSIIAKTTLSLDPEAASFPSSNPNNQIDAIRETYPWIRAIEIFAARNPQQLIDLQAHFATDPVRTTYLATRALNYLWRDFASVTREDIKSFEKILSDYKKIPGAQLGILEACSMLSILLDTRGLEPLYTPSADITKAKDLLEKVPLIIPYRHQHAFFTQLRQRTQIPNDALISNNLALISAHTLLSFLNPMGRVALYQLVDTNKIVVDTIKSSPIKALNSIPLEKLQNKLALYSSEPVLFSDPVWDDWQVVEE